MSRRRAPKCLVVSWERVGGWGSVAYAHLLECGHVEVRRRLVREGRLGCVACLPVVDVVVDDVVDDVDDGLVGDVVMISDDFQVEVEAQRLQALLASSLGVPMESVDVVLSVVDGVLGVSSVLLHLSADDAFRIANPI